MNDLEHVSRRGFLRVGTLGAGTLALTAAGVETEAAMADTQEASTIDAHVHVWTPDTRTYPLAPGYKKDRMALASFTPQELFSHAQPCGVERIVLIQMSYYGFDNSYMLDMMQKHPGVFSGVAVIDRGHEPKRTMIELAEKGVRGFRLGMGKGPADGWLDDRGMAAIWTCGGEQGLSMCLLIDPGHLPVVDKMCDKFPDTPVVIDHLARIGIDGVVRPSDLDNLCRLARHGNVYVKVSAFYALGKKQAPYLDLAPMFRRVLDAFGPERLMWASDCPFQVMEGHTYRDSIDLIRRRIDFLSAADRHWLLRRTAQGVFFS